MKTAVIYTSQTGFTERYARWIAEAAGADCLTLAQAKKMDFSGYDAIVYGGWAFAGSIRGLAWFRRAMKRWNGKRLAVFCVGASPAGSPDVIPTLRRNFTAEELERVQLFYCPGGFAYERMGLVSRLMMKAFIATLKSKKGNTAEDEQIIRMISSSYDASDRMHIEPILRYLR